jgi:hypothetical protein
MDMVDLDAPLLGGNIVEVKGDAGNPIHEYDAIAQCYGAIMSWDSAGGGLQKEIAKYKLQNHIHILGTILQQQIPSYLYKTDYNVGDIVSIENEFGLTVNARIVEVTETWDKEGYTINPVFEFEEFSEAVQKALLTQDYEIILTEDGNVLSQE